MLQLSQQIKPKLSSQREIKMGTCMITTPTSSRSQQFIALKLSPTSSQNDGSQKMGYKTLQKSQFCQNGPKNKFFDTSDMNISIIKECVSTLIEIRTTSKNINKNTTSETQLKIRNIDSLVNEMLPQDYNSRIQSRLNDEKIQTFMKQLMDEKTQKYQAIKSGENLIKQQAEQIKQLKNRIQLYQ